MAATLTEDRRAMIVSVVNVGDTAMSFDLKLDGFKVAATGTSWTLTGPTLDAENAVGKAPQMVIVEGSFDTSRSSLTVGPRSIELYRFDAA